jgi:predicted alpha-1,6-mannanase (GH76 family)
VSKIAQLFFQGKNMVGDETHRNGGGSDAGLSGGIRRRYNALHTAATPSDGLHDQELRNML